eukprot:gene1331-30764_t
MRQLADPRSASSSPCSSPGPVRNSGSRYRAHNRGRSASPQVPDVEMHHHRQQYAAMLARAGSSLSVKTEPGSIFSAAGFSTSPSAEALSSNLIEHLLPGHKIARGRGRRKQLEQMSEAEKKAEKEARMEKMRISARECRLRKKHNIATLETKLEQYEAKDKRNRNTITRLKDEVRRLQDNLRALNQGHAAVHREQQQQQQQQQQQHEQPYPHQQEEHACVRQSPTIADDEEDTMTYTTVHEPAAAPPALAAEWVKKPLKLSTAVSSSGYAPKAIKAEPGMYSQGFQQMTGARRSSLVVDTSGGGGSSAGTSKDAISSDLQLFLQQSGGGSLTPITPKMQLDSLLVPGFQLPHSPANPTFSSFNFGEVDQMLLG